MASLAVVIRTLCPYTVVYEPALRLLADRLPVLCCFHGVDCSAWEEALDWVMIETGRDVELFALTSSHPGEDENEVLDFARACSTHGTTELLCMTLPESVAI
ncbi:hypothetical protein [Chitinimonas prasina]|uniref:hypothetical protein n=1 Tax=Chitinimonas prasina TaxID=1434937 RepID=UPI0024E0F57F|nr:hypothetical protein [Chitinimonas prasina]